jgi:N-acetylmuramoyl-L-alanine amidase
VLALRECGAGGKTTPSIASGSVNRFRYNEASGNNDVTRVSARPRDVPLKLIRLSSLFLATAIAVLLPFAIVGPVGGQSAVSSSLTIISKDGRRAVPLSGSGDQELVFLDDLAAAFQLTIREESLGALAVSYKGKTILMTPDQPLVSIAGRLVSLPSPPTRSGRRWLVPVEFTNRALSLIYDARLDLRKASRLLIVGDLRVPRIAVRFENGDPARLIVDASPRTNSTISQENNSLTVKFEADGLDAVVPPIQPGPLLQAVRLQEPGALLIEVGPRFVAFRASTQPLETSTRLTVDLQSTPTQTAPAPAPPAGLPPPTPETPLPPDLSALNQLAVGIRTIAIDPGHGGEDEGVKGAKGAKEKELVLTVARRIKSTIEGRLGIRVLLTRDDDRNVALDSRAAMANNNKADLLISVHANASFRKTATGASILYASFDPEAEQRGRASLSAERLPTFGGGLRDLDLVLWDLAQIRHLGRSAEFAKILEEQLHDRIPLSSHSVDRAPLDILESANMPAVMIEMGYLSNPDQETQMAGMEFQTAVAQAIYDAVLKFREVIGAGTR